MNAEDRIGEEIRDSLTKFEGTITGVYIERRGVSYSVTASDGESVWVQAENVETIAPE